MNAPAPVPLPPTLTTHLFPELGRRLIELLRRLQESDWTRPTVAPAWVVRDLAAHLLDSALRRLAFGRDRQTPPPPETPIGGYRDLVAFLDRLNAEWVRASRRLSPRLLTDLLEWVEPQLADHLAAVDPWAPALFGVDWAGESASQGWFDIARELTERWHHQQQIRLAVGAPPLRDPELSAAVFDTFLRALPHRFAGLEAADGSTVAVVVRGAATLSYLLRREPGGWRLLRGESEGADAHLELDEEPAWLALTKGLDGSAARRRAVVRGEARLVEPFFGTLAVMA